MFRSSNFDKLLDRATSNLRLEPDWPAIIQICDLIRQGDVPAKYALAALKKKIYHANPHVAMFGLQVLESVVKNCGSLVHDEVGTKSYMEQLRDLVKNTTHENVRNKALELVQAWAYAFRNSPKYRAVQDTVNIMKTEGYPFPVLKESDAMFSADTAPEWAEGECCHRCRVQFSMMQRKHHCRACGQVFCHQCSSKTSTLPKFGIEKEVRVCEACYDKFNKPSTTPSKHDTDLPPEYLSSSLAQQTQVPPRKTEEELREEEEFQLALALSKSEAEEKEKEKLRATSSILSAASKIKQQQSSTIVQNEPVASLDNGEADSELARYLNRSYWEQRQETGGPVAQASQPSAPATKVQVSSPLNLSPRKQTDGEAGGEIEEFASNLKGQVEIFVNRMKSNSSRGRSITNDSSVQTLFMNISTMHCQLLGYIEQTDDRRVYYEGLQDKLAQVRDARAALDALREEHQEKLKRQAEELERQRQIQMAHKLDIMRKKKQEYLQYQRQLALQRIQEQEREMQMRQEQQKQHYLMGSMTTAYPYLQNTMAPPPPTQAGPQPGNYAPPSVEAAPLQYPPVQYQSGQYPTPGVQYPEYQHPYMNQGPRGPPGPPFGAGGPAPPQQVMMGPGSIPGGMPPSGSHNMPPTGMPPQGPQGMPPQGPQGMHHQGPGIPPSAAASGMHGPPMSMQPPPSSLQMSPPGHQQPPPPMQSQMPPMPMGQPGMPQSPVMHPPPMQQHFSQPNMIHQQPMEQHAPPSQPQTAELISFD